MRTIRLETVIAASIGDCFGLSLSVDAHAASMQGSKERAIGGVTSGVMRLGDSVTWRARHFGIVFRMTSAITECQPPSRFVDEQQHGPFRRWQHEHTFTPLANGQTRMIDIVHFQSPFGPLGCLAAWCSVTTCRTCFGSATPGSRPLWKNERPAEDPARPPPGTPGFAW